jgi:hypothetical protein
MPKPRSQRPRKARPSRAPRRVPAAQALSLYRPLKTKIVERVDLIINVTGDTNGFIVGMDFYDIMNLTTSATQKYACYVELYAACRLKKLKAICYVDLLASGATAVLNLVGAILRQPPIFAYAGSNLIATTTSQLTNNYSETNHTAQSYDVGTFLKPNMIQYRPKALAMKEFFPLTAKMNPSNTWVTGDLGYPQRDFLVFQADQTTTLRIEILAEFEMWGHSNSSWALPSPKADSGIVGIVPEVKIVDSFHPDFVPDPKNFRTREEYIAAIPVRK